MRDENDQGRAGKDHGPLISEGGLSRRQISEERWGASESSARS